MLLQSLGDAEWQAHTHVTTTLTGERADLPLETCVVGVGPSEAAAVEQAAKIWLELVGCFIYSLLTQVEQMEARHFHDHEPWGVPGAHGFVSPVFVRGKLDDEGDAVVSMPLFASVGRALPGAFDGRPHILKATARGLPGRFMTRDRWGLFVELDGHAACVELRAQRLGVVAKPWVTIRYALCFPGTPAKFRI